MTKFNLKEKLVLAGPLHDIKDQVKRGKFMGFSINLQNPLKKTKKLVFRNGETHIQNAETHLENAESP